MDEQNKIIRSLEIVCDYALLNMLWLFFSLPIITIFPATTSMFHILQEWTKGEEIPIWKSFLHYFKKDLYKGMAVGIIMIFSMVILAVDIMVVTTLRNPWRSIGLPIITIISFLFLFMSIYLIPLFTKFRVSLVKLFSMAFVLTIKKPCQPAMVSLLLFILFYISFNTFLTILIVFSISGWLHYKIIIRPIEAIIKV